MYDYCIVGQGLSGSLLAMELLNRGKSVLVIQSRTITRSSEVAPGMFNPLVLKRFTLAWKAPELIPYLNTYYSNLESILSTSFLQDMELHRLFHDVKEMNLWIEKSDQLSLDPFMDNTIYNQKNSSVIKNVGLGKVLQTGRVVLNTFISAVSDYIKENASLVNDVFDYSKVSVSKDHVTYKDFTFKHIIFSEGFGLKQNPFFSSLPLKGTKGELITIYAPELNLDFPLKSSVLIMPLGDDKYRVGASFNWDDKDYIPTEVGKNWVISKLEQIINCNFEVIEHDAGIRPTVIDRRPLLGTHHEYSNIHVFNGMGTRGVMLAPFGVNMLLNSIEKHIPLDPEWDIKRFKEDA